MREKDDLLGAMCDAVLGDLEAIEPEGDWDAQLRAWATTLHDRLGAAPALVTVLAAAPITPAALELARTVLDLLDRAGFPPVLAAGAIDATSSYVLGRAVVEAAPAPEIPPGSPGASLVGMPAELLVCHLGRVEYRAATALQESLRARVQSGELADVLLLLEHPPVYTRGRRSDRSEIPMGEAWYRAQGIDVVQTDRGGKLTYHGPGQLVGYPIMRIDDVIAYLRTMEAAICAALAQEGVSGGAVDGLTGVWVQDRKIGSIGVHVSRGVTTHGFAINVDNDLQPFEWVVPCGIEGVRMTSLARETGTRDAETFRCFRRRTALAFAEAFGRRQRLVTPERLGIAERDLSPRVPALV